MNDQLSTDGRAKKPDFAECLSQFSTSRKRVYSIPLPAGRKCWTKTDRWPIHNGSNPARTAPTKIAIFSARRGHLRKLRRALVLRLCMPESVAATKAWRSRVFARPTARPHPASLLAKLGASSANPNPAWTRLAPSSTRSSSTITEILISEVVII
jgi:hypothetical protein